MFGIGWPEFLLIVMVAIFVIGPNELPHALFQLGKALKKFREMSNSLQKVFDDVTRDEEFDEIVSKANNVSDANIQMEMERQTKIENQRSEIEALEEEGDEPSLVNEKKRVDDD